MRYQGQDTVHHNPLDVLNWPLAVCSVSVLPFLDTLWQHVPGPTVIYMVVSAAFMLFQMSDKLGLLERFKRRPALLTPPEEPPQEH